MVEKGAPANSNTTIPHPVTPPSSDSIEVDMAETNPGVISWDGPLDPSNPLNWSPRRKWTATLLVSCFTFISPFSSTMVTPVLDDIGAEFGITDDFAKTLVMTIFLLGYAQGPFVLAPLSEMFGRVRVLQYANLVYLAFNTACGFARNRRQILACRFLSGIGGSAPQAICNGVLADIWRKEERGKGQSIYGMLTFIAPTVAPIVGAYIAQGASWRWIFWTTSILDVAVQVAALFFLKETYAPTILARKVARVRREMETETETETGGNLSLNLRSEYDTPDKSPGAIMRKRLVLPFIMLFAHPVVQLSSIYRAFMYGMMYLVLSTFNKVWQVQYGMSPTIASLNYLSLCVGFLIGLQISHPLMDGLYARFKKIYSTEDGVPEWRIPPMIIGGIVTPIGLIMYGWSAQAHVHWIVPNLGCVLLAIGLIVAFQSAQAYIVDSYGAGYAASAAAVGSFLRTMCGFSFPLFAPALYDALDLGWGNTLLAGVTLVIGIPSPALFWWYGEKLRGWSKAGLL